VRHPILVTGATGTVGSRVLKRLAAEGAEVRAAVHTASRGRFIRDSSIEIVTVDYAQPDTIAAALQGIKRVFLLTPLLPDMVAITKRVVDLAKAAGVEYIVKLSALGAGPAPSIVLAQWHTEAEHIVGRSGLHWTFLRPNSFMQNYVNYHHGSIRGENAFYLPHGEGEISFVDARDIGSVAAAVLLQKGHEGKTYTLTGPAALSNIVVAEILSKVTGRAITYVDVGDDEARKRMKHEGSPEWMIEAMMELHDLSRSGMASEVYPDIATVTGKPATGFEQFARDHAPMFK
jgi:uncharacterized protein YbjT (DUF2867 family)